MDPPAAAFTAGFNDVLVLIGVNPNGALAAALRHIAVTAASPQPLPSPPNIVYHELIQAGQQQQPTTVKEDGAAGLPPTHNHQQPPSPSSSIDRHSPADDPLLLHYLGLRSLQEECKQQPQDASTMLLNELFRQMQQPLLQQLRWQANPMKSPPVQQLQLKPFLVRQQFLPLTHQQMTHLLTKEQSQQAHYECFSATSAVVTVHQQGNMKGGVSEENAHIFASRPQTIARSDGTQMDMQ